MYLVGLHIYYKMIHGHYNIREEVFATKHEIDRIDPLPQIREVLSSNLGEETGHSDWCLWRLS